MSDKISFSNKLDKNEKFKYQNDDSGVKKIYRRIILPMFILNVISFLVTLIWGFDIKNLVGFLIGYIYVVLGYAYLANAVIKAVEMNEKKARRAMMICYSVRFAGLFILSYIALELKLFSVVGILLPQLYPRMVISIDALLGKNYLERD